MTSTTTASTTSTAAAAPTTTESKTKAASTMSIDERIKLIVRNLDEVMGKDAAIEEMKKTLTNTGDLKIYWGTATTGRPHIGYFVPMSKIADFLNAGVSVTILFADLHAYLDNQKAPWELLKLRTNYYEQVIKGMLQSIGVPIEKLRFVRGTDYQLSKEYTLDMYRLTSMTTERNAKKAGAEVVKQVDNALLSGMLYPLLQALDEQYLGVDCQFGGVDQRKIFAFAEENLPRLGFKKRVHLMNPMVPGLQGDKMSSSEKGGKIDLLDDAKIVKDKISRAFCEEGNINNGLLAFAKMVLYPLSKAGVQVRRKADNGGDRLYTNYEDLEKDFADKKLHPGDLKPAIAGAIDALLEPIRKKFEDKTLRQLVCDAYPEDSEAFKQVSAKASKKVGEKKAADISDFEIKVGQIKSAAQVTGSDTLLALEIDLDEEKTRPVVSGLAKFYQCDKLKDQLCSVLCNIKPTSMRGAKSNARLLAATTADKSKMEIVEPPKGVKVGERITFSGFETRAEPARANEKVIDTVLAQLKTNADGIACFNTTPFNTTQGPCSVPTLKNLPVG